MPAIYYQLQKKKKKVIEVTHDKHALQMFLANGSAQLLFSKMSTGALRTAERANKKPTLEK